MHGLISLLLKKPGLVKKFVSNYRPIKNLDFVSKELECNSRRQVKRSGGIQKQKKKYTPLCPFHLTAATHSPIKCPLSVDERRKILESSDGCFNCQTLGHRIDSCKSTWVQPCRNCGDRHHGAVCKAAPKDTTATPPTPPSEGVTGPKVNFYSTAQGPKTILKKGSAMVTMEERPEEE